MRQQSESRFAAVSCANFFPLIGAVACFAFPPQAEARSSAHSYSYELPEAEVTVVERKVPRVLIRELESAMHPGSAATPDDGDRRNDKESPDMEPASKTGTVQAEQKTKTIRSQG